MKLYDLHSHSYYSDGILSPAELIKRAKQQGVDVLALTDHDTLDGIFEAKLQAKKSNIELLVGVEISVTWQGKLIHIVALNVDENNQQLITGLQYNQHLRDERASKMAIKLEKLGLKNVLAEVTKLANHAAITRTHFARYLIQQGLAKTMDEVFKKFIVPGKPGYVKMQWVDMQQALAWIKQAGGVAVIAHPGRYKMTRSWLLRLIDDFMLWGGQGIEVAFSTANKDEVKKFAEYAKSFSLLGSIGSDFHDPNMHWIELGMHKNLPEGVAPVWQAFE